MKLKTDKKHVIDSLTVTASALAGGLAGAAIGRPSGLLGIATTIIGVLAEQPHITVAGAGMMVAGAGQSRNTEDEIKANSTANVKTGLREEVSYGKDRTGKFLGEMKKKLFLDKLIKPKAENATPAPETVSGLGYAYYDQPNEFEVARVIAEMESQGVGNLDLLMHRPSMGNLDVLMHTDAIHGLDGYKYVFNN